MAKIYFSLILKGLKTLDDVPEQLREEVRSLLEAEEAKTIPEQEYPDILIPDEIDPEHAVDDDISAEWIPPENFEDDSDTDHTPDSGVEE